ncbi:copper resistance system multicopper oxidase [Rhodocaloribacter litoris]|nr:copper resistance system multicopper oxidase [Rhodocaloribacter litoris]
MTLETAPLSRRTFLHQAAAFGLLAGIKHLLPAYARPLTGGLTPPVAGSRPPTVYELTIAETGLRFGGRHARATTINGTVPGPLLRFREGEEVVLKVTNRLKEDTSIHWHGLLVPFNMDGVPGVSFPGIRPGETFTYRFALRQSGTYWYHSHSGLQEQTGVYGPIIVDPAGDDPVAYDREHVVVLSDWTFEDPHRVLRKLRKMPGYYNFQRQTLLGLLRGEDLSLRDRLRWGRMRMDATDLADVTGATYTYLMNGLAPEDNWTALFRPGERVRLRFINAGAGSFFDVRIPGLPLTIVQADGQNVQPVTVDEFRIGIAETYDVIVEPREDRAYTIFAESMDRSGYARGTLAPREGLQAPVPEQRRRPARSMADMGMDHGNMQGMDHGNMPGMDHGNMPGMDHGNMPGMDHGNMPGMDHGNMPGMDHEGHGMQMGAMAGLAPPGTLPPAVPHGEDTHGPGNAAVPMMTRSRLHEPGIGLGNDGRRVLVYTDLKSMEPTIDMPPPTREIELHLTGNMERYMWSIDGKAYSEAPEPIRIEKGERVRITFVNDTMMEHPMHLHGMWMMLENGHFPHLPRKHTLIVKPAERLSVLVVPDETGPWVFHCHILYHMDMGMFRVVEVTEPATAEVSQ